MGQQQLLLLVLSAVIVGVAIVSGINLVEDSNAQADEDAVRQELLTIASQAQAWYLKPGILGGGDRNFTSFVQGDIRWVKPSILLETSFPLKMVTQTQLGLRQRLVQCLPPKNLS